MMLVDISVWPQGDIVKEIPVAGISICNINGTEDVADYEVYMEPGRVRATVRGHRRADGWLPLVQAALVALREQQ